MHIYLQISDSPKITHTHTKKEKKKNSLRYLFKFIIYKDCVILIGNHNNNKKNMVYRKQINAKYYL